MELEAMPVDTGEDYDTEPPVLDGLEQVAYHVRRVREERAELEALEAVYRAELERMKDRWENRREVIENRIAWHLIPVESWHRSHPDTRTIEVPHGTLKLSVPKTLKVFIGSGDDDKAKVRQWAIESHPEILGDPLVTKVRSVTLVVDGRVVDADTGEIVPGVTAVLPDPSWSLDTDPGSPW
jgi:hypothetical protein